MEVNRIYNMDCIEGMQSIPDRSIEWVRLKEGNGLYSICKEGFVKKDDWVEIQKNGKTRTKKGFICKKIFAQGIVYVNINGKTKNLSILVLNTFSCNPLGLKYVRHKDGNAFNNHISNLEWCSKERQVMSDIADKSEKQYLEEYYDISKDGQVKRKKDGKIFAPVKDKKGYYMIRLKSPAFSKNKDKRKNYKVHRLVAMFYLDDYSEDLQVNHKNGIKTDNRVENLEMVTNRQNVLHAWRELDSSNRRRLVAQRNASDKERISKIIQASIRANSKTVTKKNDKGEVVSIYESSTKAAIAEGISGARMSYIIRHHKLRNNCYFYYE